LGVYCLDASITAPCPTRNATCIHPSHPQREKEAGGVPDVNGNKLVEVELASIEDRKLRGSLRDANYVEAQVGV
jgi:hypothetical protein